MKVVYLWNGLSLDEMTDQNGEKFNATKKSIKRRNYEYVMS